MDSATTNKPTVSPASVSPAMTIDEFCERYGITRQHFYILRNRGEGPLEIRVGSRQIRISVEAAIAWEKSRTKQPAAAVAPPAEQPAPQPPIRTRAKRKPVA